MLSGERYIDVEGASLRVRSAGTGPAVMLVHGWALDLDMWQTQIELLAHRYRVIAFDRRGFGLSSGAPGIEQDVNDIGRLLHQFDISRVAIVGMSQGARVALRWALKYPEQASCLVLDGPPAEGLSEPLGTQEIPMESYRSWIRRGGIDAFRRMWLQHPFMQLHTSRPGARLLLQEIATRYPALDLLTNKLPQLPLLTGHDLQRLHVPTLILSGEYDLLQRRSIASQLAQSVPGARLKIVAGAGHLAALDDPGAYVQALHAFFSSQPAMAAGALM